MLIHREGLERKTDDLIKSFVQGAPTGEMKLTAFVGTILRTVVQNMNEQLGIEITELVSRYLAYIHALSANEKEMLTDFLDEKLS